MRYWLTTFSGKKLNYENPQPDQINLIDIFQALSQLCRFSGQTRYFYSVAQHSLNCQLLAKLMFNANEETQLSCLLHDAHETYISDIPSNLKKYINNDLQYTGILNKIENDIDNCIYLKIFESIKNYSIFNAKINFDVVKEVDQIMLLTEYDKLTGKDKSDWNIDKNIQPITDFIKYPLYIINYEKNIIRTHFIQIFNQLVDRIKVKYV